MDTLPASEAEEAGEGLLANVSGAVIAPPGADAASVTELRSLLAGLCEEVLVSPVQPDASPLAILIAALEATEAERVLVLDAAEPGTSVELALGLVAWPEHPIVHPAGSWAAAIYRRGTVLEAARERLNAGDGELEGLRASFEVGELGGDDLAALSAAG